MGSIDQVTSNTCRPAYQPQLAHARWGNLTAPQRGHKLRGELAIRQAAARRLRVFDLDVFFFGTAIVNLAT